MCGHVLLGASSLDGEIGGRCERSVDGADVGSNYVDESLRTSQSSTAPSWQVLRMGDGRMISVQDSCPQKKTLMRHAEDVQWQTWAKKHEIEELEGGVWVRTDQSFMEKKAQSPTWVN